MPDDKHQTERPQTERPQAEAEPCRMTASASAFVRGALLLQEKWVLLIVHSLLGGSISFSELMRRGNVNTTTLTQRLTLLERVGVLVKTIHSTMPPRTSYALTEAGQALRPVLDAIAHWSETHMPPLPEPCPGGQPGESACPGGSGCLGEDAP